MQSGGHSVAAGRLDAQDSVAGFINEQLGGLAQLEYLNALAKRVDEDWDSVVADLEKVSRPSGRSAPVPSPTSPRTPRPWSPPRAR